MKALAVLQSGQVTDLITTDDERGPRDAATLADFFEDTLFSAHLCEVGEHVPEHVRQWDSLGRYLYRWGCVIKDES